MYVVLLMSVGKAVSNNVVVRHNIQIGTSKVPSALCKVRAVGLAGDPGWQCSMVQVLMSIPCLGLVFVCMYERALSLELISGKRRWVFGFLGSVPFCLEWGVMWG